jgi:hypothetical protein
MGRITEGRISFDTAGRVDFDAEGQTSLDFDAPTSPRIRVEMAGDISIYLGNDPVPILEDNGMRAYISDDGGRTWRRDEGD